MWLRRPDEMTHLPRGTVAARSLGANFESIPWQPLLTPVFTSFVGLIVAASNSGDCNFKGAVYKTVNIAAQNDSAFILMLRRPDFTYDTVRAEMFLKRFSGRITAMSEKCMTHSSPIVCGSPNF